MDSIDRRTILTGGALALAGAAKGDVQLCKLQSLPDMSIRIV